jgi:hypothetical protein
VDDDNLDNTNGESEEDDIDESEDEAESRIYKNADSIVKEATRLGIKVIRDLSLDSTISSEFSFLKILNPKKEPLKEQFDNWEKKDFKIKSEKAQNYNSIAIQITKESWMGLFTADSQLHSYYNYIKDVKWNYIKINHHGSLQSLTNNLKKEESLFNLECQLFGLCGGGRRHQLPHPDIWKMLSDTRIAFVKTETNWPSRTDSVETHTKLLKTQTCYIPYEGKMKIQTIDDLTL